MRAVLSTLSCLLTGAACLPAAESHPFDIDASDTQIAWVPADRAGQDDDLFVRYAAAEDRNADRMEVQSVAVLNKDVIVAKYAPAHLAPLIVPGAFDAAQFAASPSYYLITVDPGRIAQSAKPAPDVPAIASPDASPATASRGAGKTLRAMTKPKMPATFVAIDGGTFDNGQACISVRADATGLAQTTFLAPMRGGEMRVLASSPCASGQLTFRIRVD